MVYHIDMLMKRITISHHQNVKNIHFNDKQGLKHCILRTPSVVDEFYFEEYQPAHDKNKSYASVDPIIILFNQQRIDNMGSTAAKAFLDSLQPQSNSLAELRQKCSDEDLMQMVKSRHLQAPAEILAWCRYMQSNIDTFNSEVQKIVEAKQAEEAAKVEAGKVDDPLKSE